MKPEHNELWTTVINYNLARVLNRLADMVEQDGGTVRYQKTILFHNRSYEPNAVRSPFVPPIGFDEMQFVFEKDGFRYCFSPNRNPFFCDYVSKNPSETKEDRWVNTAAIEAENKAWLLDELFRPNITDEPIEKAARILYGIIINLSIDENKKDKRGRLLMTTLMMCRMANAWSVERTR